MELGEFLDFKFSQYNNPDFINSDPISIPHRFSQKEDIEISAFLTSIISWGQRQTILKNAQKLMDLMDNAPHDFILNFRKNDLKIFCTFRHRTFNGDDCVYFLKSLQHIYKDLGGLSNVFEDSLNVHNRDIGMAISTFRKKFLSFKSPDRSSKHIADPMKNSSAKRLCMFLRWMIRSDGKGVDFGLWKTISPSMLAIPLDLHSGRVARSLELLNGNQNDWKSVMELTRILRKFDPDDPAKYDFALFGIGINEKIIY